MKLKDSKEAYYELTGIASNVNRQLGFAGIAIIWIFCQILDGKVLIPERLTISAVLIVMSLSFDLLQYIMGSIIWGSFHRFYERKGKKEDDKVNASRYLNYPQNICFALKIVSMLLSYVYLLLFLFSNIVNT